MDDPVHIYLLECPGCGIPLVGRSETIQVDFDEYIETRLERVWPKPKRATAIQIPKSARDSLEEARRCFDAKAFNACVVMCSRALEAICKDHSIKMRSLMTGLKALKEKGVIDGRLYEWGDALREARNIGAHAAESETTREDAKDLLDFTYAIGEYVYVLTGKYNDFLSRKQKLQKSESPKLK